MTDKEGEETCPNGEKWCEGGEGDQLPYFNTSTMRDRRSVNEHCLGGKSR